MRQNRDWETQFVELRAELDRQNAELEQVFAALDGCTHRIDVDERELDALRELTLVPDRRSVQVWLGARC